VAIRVVRLGSPRAEQEGIRIGTVRRPPRGIPREEYSSRNYYDVWFPNLAPSAELIKVGKAADEARAWQNFARRYRAEMSTPENSRTIDLLAALSHQTHFSVGCYCADEEHCHRSILRELLAEHGARLL
jgi:uncharacterized protein YeaO (DUF488 family)